MSKTIIAPNYINSIDGPVIFLAGPIQGAADWQTDAIQIINKHAPDLYVASPRQTIKSLSDFTKEMYNTQVDWETYHLREAGKNGVVLFWLAKEFEHRCNRAYAQTTRFELAEWKLRHERDRSNLSLVSMKGLLAINTLSDVSHKTAQMFQSTELSKIPVWVPSRYCDQQMFHE